MSPGTTASGTGPRGTSTSRPAASSRSPTSSPTPASSIAKPVISASSPAVPAAAWAPASRTRRALPPRRLRSRRGGAFSQAFRSDASPSAAHEERDQPDQGRDHGEDEQPLDHEAQADEERHQQRENDQ